MVHEAPQFFEEVLTLKHPAPDEMKDLMKMATSIENLDALDLLITAGGDVNWTDGTGLALVQYAAVQNCEIETLDFLLSRGADLNVLNEKGKTLLHYCALGNSNLQVFELLMRRGLDPTALDDEGRTPLFEACCYNSSQVVSFCWKKVAKSLQLTSTN